MSDDSKTRKTKPGAGTPGFAQSTWWLVAFIFYGIGPAGATIYLPLLSIALVGARYGTALL